MSSDGMNTFSLVSKDAEKESLQINFAALSCRRYTGRCTMRVLRGGAWNNQPNNLSCAIRNRNEPDIRNNNIGLRCAKTPLGNEPKKKRSQGDKILQALSSRKPAAHGLPESGTGVFTAPVRCSACHAEPNIK